MANTPPHPNNDDPAQKLLAEAEAAKMMAEADKIATENRVLREQQLSAWYKSPAFYKFLGAGIGVAPIIIAYFMLVYNPFLETEQLEQKRDALNLEIQQKQAKIDHMRIDSMVKSMQAQLIALTEDLDAQNKANRDLTEYYKKRIALLQDRDCFTTVEQQQIADINAEIVSKERDYVTMDTKIRKLANTAQQIRDPFSTVNELRSGWIYLGQLHDNGWGTSNTIDMGDSIPTTKKNYTIVKPKVKLHTDNPKGILFNHEKYVRILEEGTTVKLLYTANIGNNKFWAEVEVVD